MVVFDLDDTLIDTRGILVPDALRRVAAAVGTPVERLNAVGKAIGEVLAGLDVTDEQRAAAAAVWYAPDVAPLTALPGARELLDALRAHPDVGLVLLTRGDPARQQQKLDACGLRGCFDEVRIRPIEGPGTKRDDLAAILAKFNVPPGRCLVVGDDEADELAHARALGCVAIKVPQATWADVERTIATLRGANPESRRKPESS